MVHHRHVYHVVADIVLSLPDTAGWREKLVQFQCACGQFSVVTGSFSLHSGPVNLPDLEARATQERQTGSLLARVAQREERVRVGRRRGVRGGTSCVLA